MEKFWILLGQNLLEYGAFGLLTITGWCLAGWFLYKDFKKKNDINATVKARDEVIKVKDAELKEVNSKLTNTIKELSDARIKDLKETTEDYNDVVTSVNHTLDKLTVALQVQSSISNHE